MTDVPDIQREWLLSKWERFTDDEIATLNGSPYDGRVMMALADEMRAEIARRQADAQSAETT